MGVFLQRIERVLEIIDKPAHASVCKFGVKQAVILPVSVVMLNGIPVNFRTVGKIIKP